MLSLSSLLVLFIAVLPVVPIVKGAHASAPDPRAALVELKAHFQRQLAESTTVHADAVVDDVTFNIKRQSDVLQCCKATCVDSGGAGCAARNDICPSNPCGYPQSLCLNSSTSSTCLQLSWNLKQGADCTSSVDNCWGGNETNPALWCVDDPSLGVNKKSCQPAYYLNGGAPCAHDYDCRSKRCTSGKCFFVENGQRCNSRIECQTDVNHDCVFNVCVEKGKPGDACSTRQPCMDVATCASISHVCVSDFSIPDDGQCDNSFQCQSAFCALQTAKCVQPPAEPPNPEKCPDGTCSDGTKSCVCDRTASGSNVCLNLDEFVWSLSGVFQDCTSHSLTLQDCLLEHRDDPACTSFGSRAPGSCCDREYLGVRCCIEACPRPAYAQLPDRLLCLDRKDMCDGLDFTCSMSWGEQVSASPDTKIHLTWIDVFGIVVGTCCVASLAFCGGLYYAVRKGRLQSMSKIFSSGLDPRRKHAVIPDDGNGDDGLGRIQ